MRSEIDTPLVARVRELATPIVSDLGLDLYDLELRGGTLRVTLDTPIGTDGGVTLDLLSLASRLLAKELDAHDPIPSRYTLEVTSPGVERQLRTPHHFRRAVGTEVAVRLSDVDSEERRLRGVITGADDDAVTVTVDGAERVLPYGVIDRARTVFEWGGAPKPGSGRRAPSKPAATSASARRRAADESVVPEPDSSDPDASDKEHQP